MKNIILMHIFLIFIFILKADTFTEIEIVNKILENNSEIKAYIKKYNSVNEAVKLEKFLPNPIISIEFMGINENKIDLNSSEIKSIEISQKIPFPLKYPFMIGEANENAEVVKYHLEYVRRQIGIEGYILYASLFKIKKEIEIVNELRRSLEQISKIISAKYGRNYKSDAAYINDLQLAQIENEYFSLQQEFEIIANKIHNISNGTVIISADDTLKEPEIAEVLVDFETLKEAALDNAPEVLMAKAMLKMKENIKNKSYLEYIPDLTIKFKKDIEPTSNNYSIMLEAEMPIWFFSNQQPRIGVAVNEYEEAVKLYEEIKNKTLSEIKEYYEQIKINERNIKLYFNILIPRAETFFKSVVLNYRSGKGEFIWVIEAQKNLLQLKREYYASIKRYVENYKKLLACCAVSFLTDKI